MRCKKKIMSKGKAKKQIQEVLENSYQQKLPREEGFKQKNGEM